jgi:hypothetical protein
MEEFLLRGLTAVLLGAAVSGGVYLYGVSKQNRRERQIKEVEEQLAEQLHYARTEEGRKVRQAIEAVRTRGPGVRPPEVGVDALELRAEAERVLAEAASEAEASDEAIAKAVTAGIAVATQRSRGERLVLPIILGVLAAAVPLTIGILSVFRTEPPDCAAYANTLLAIHQQAPSNEAAVAAGTAFKWGSLDEHCGLPADFITPLGDPPPPSSP